MFKRFLGRQHLANQAIVDALYAEIVAAARQPALYTRCLTPDTPLGRFEMIGLHAFLVLERLGRETGAASDVAQELTDRFFADLEDALRELGIGDAGVPKRMKKLARMFFGRTLAYRKALEDGDGLMLAEALARNVRPGTARDEAAVALAAYVMESERMLAGQPAAALLAGSVVFADAATSGEGAA